MGCEALWYVQTTSLSKIQFGQEWAAQQWEVLQDKVKKNPFIVAYRKRTSRGIKNRDSVIHIIFFCCLLYIYWNSCLAVRRVDLVGYVPSSRADRANRRRFVLCTLVALLSLKSVISEKRDNIQYARKSVETSLEIRSLIFFSYYFRCMYSFFSFFVSFMKCAICGKR